jgi:hypothetical protein
MSDAMTADVVLVDTPESDELAPAITVGSSEDGMRVLPVSERVDLATEWDVLLDPPLLGYAAMAEVWNYGTVLPEQLAAIITAVPVTLHQALKDVLRAAHEGKSAPADVPTGPPILSDDDPRLLFQDEESERLRPFWEPTLVLAGALTLGQLVHHRREELALTADELEDVGPRADWLPELEAEALDIPSTLTPTALANLMRRLRIAASARLGRIAWTTLQSQPPALARRAEQPPDAGEVKRYVDAFLRELKEQER